MTLAESTAYLAGAVGRGVAEERERGQEASRAASEAKQRLFKQLLPEFWDRVRSVADATIGAYNDDYGSQRLSLEVHPDRMRFRLDMGSAGTAATELLVKVDSAYSRDSRDSGGGYGPGWTSGSAAIHLDGNKLKTFYGNELVTVDEFIEQILRRLLGHV